MSDKEFNGRPLRVKKAVSAKRLEKKQRKVEEKRLARRSERAAYLDPVDTDMKKFIKKYDQAPRRDIMIGNEVKMKKYHQKKVEQERRKSYDGRSKTKDRIEKKMFAPKPRFKHVLKRRRDKKRAHNIKQAKQI